MRDNPALKAELKTILMSSFIVGNRWLFFFVPILPAVTGGSISIIIHRYRSKQPNDSLFGVTNERRAQLTLLGDKPAALVLKDLQKSNFSRGFSLRLLPG